MTVSGTRKRGTRKNEEASMRRAFSSYLRTALVILVSALALGSCGGPSSQPSPAPHGLQVLHVGLVGSLYLNQLDPAGTADRNSSLIRSLLFPPLITVDRQLNLKPWAATELPSIANGGISPDGLTYTFPIRSGLKWNDGVPIDANTYAYSLNRSLDPCTRDGAAFLLHAIKGAAAFNSGLCNASNTLIGSSLVAVDDLTLRITLEHPYAYFLYQLTTSQAFAQPKQAIDQFGAANWTNYLSSVGGSVGAGECTLGSPFILDSKPSKRGSRASCKHSNWQ